MTVVLIIALIAVSVALVCVLLGAAAARRAGSGPDPLEWLMDLRSPSGSRFFPTRASARDLLKTIEEDIPDDAVTAPSRDRPPSA